MAINKVINNSTKSHGAMKNVIKYVLQDQKVREGYVDITGPYSPPVIYPKGVYRSFLKEKKIWNKDSGRMYTHNVIAFHKDEEVTPDVCLAIGRAFVDRFFPDHQSLIGVHQDKDNLHVHIITNTVSYIDGRKLHQTKHDLEEQKEFTNQICQARGLTTAKKGKHFDGTDLMEGDIIAWKKDKYNLLINGSKKSYVAECAMAVLESKVNCGSREEFIDRMSEQGWHTTWTDRRKHITFQNKKGEKVRDNNLNKTFDLNISKEELLHEFERQNEIRIRGSSADRSEDIGSFIRELNAKERASAEKRDHHISERTDRETQRKRSRSEKERGTSGRKPKTSAADRRRKSTGKYRDLSR